MVEVIKEGEIVSLNEDRFKCLVEQIELPEIITKQYLLYLCYKDILQELN